MNTESAISKAFDFVGGNSANQQKVDTLLAHFDGIEGVTNKVRLAKTLLLKVEARYMVTTNIDTSDGLVNGITDVLKRIDYGIIVSSSITTTNSKKPLRIWILFDDTNVGKNARRAQQNLRSTVGVDAELTMMEPHKMNINSHCYKSGLTVMRTQFPICPAEALTIHKSQGSTFSRVVVYDIDRTKTSRPLLYVGCSRAMSASGLTLICKDNEFKVPISLFQSVSSL